MRKYTLIALLVAIIATVAYAASVDNVIPAKGSSGKVILAPKDASGNLIPVLEADGVTSKVTTPAGISFNADTIGETTPNAGVTIDGTKIKDKAISAASTVSVNGVNFATSGSVTLPENQLLGTDRMASSTGLSDISFDNGIKVDNIGEKTTSNGVFVEQVNVAAGDVILPSNKTVRSDKFENAGGIGAPSFTYGLLTESNKSGSPPLSCTGQVCAGQWTGTGGGCTNCTFNTWSDGKFVRVGNIVFFTALMTITPTLANNRLRIRFSNPTGEGFGSGADVTGTCTAFFDATNTPSTKSIGGVLSEDDGTEEIMCVISLPSLELYSIGVSGSYVVN